ncbi:unnamed protein product [Bursaphelenchus okinawaensis]|uniref:Uncharacterized protein n=1 Tax=Bursaphelenchus okinawaensis TaxID=465554 RepID=A0A811L1A5_9BILA|nr:unnamed protein product [Bursaphelenchus okinawaensis]CAG9114298.1 unnamed protein product [Bursaphelenchus okinawaensis]
MLLMELEHTHLDDRRVRQEEQAAVVIQRFYRTQRGLRQQKLEHAAIVLQSHIRRFLAMRRYERMRRMYSAGRPIDEEELREGAEADQLEAFELLHSVIENPGQFDISERDQKLQNIYKRSEDRAATKIQRFYRSQRQQKLDKAAIVLQSHIRRFLAVRRYNRMKTARLEAPKQNIEIQITAPTEEAQPQNDRLFDRESTPEVEEAAKKIQRFYRSHRHHMHKRLNNAATVIQSYIRRYLAQKRVQRMKMDMNMEQNAISNGGNLDFEANLDDTNLEKAATKIQSVWRGFSTRRKLSNTNPPFQEQDSNVTLPQIPLS